MTSLFLPLPPLGSAKSTKSSQYGGPLGIRPEALKVWDDLQQSKGGDWNQMKAHLNEALDECRSKGSQTEDDARGYALSLRDKLLVEHVQDRLNSTEKSITVSRVDQDDPISKIWGYVLEDGHDGPGSRHEYEPEEYTASAHSYFILGDDKFFALPTEESCELLFRLCRENEQGSGRSVSPNESEGTLQDAPTATTEPTDEKRHRQAQLEILKELVENFDVGHTSHDKQNTWVPGPNLEIEKDGSSKWEWKIRSKTSKPDSCLFTGQLICASGSKEDPSVLERYAVSKDPNAKATAALADDNRDEIGVDFRGGSEFIKPEYRLEHFDTDPAPSTFSL